jgi:hypothetical protein
MKRARLALSAATALALIAFFGISAASAAAVPIALCDTEEAACQGDNQYPAGTKLETSTKSFVFKRGLLKITCTSSNLDILTAVPGELIGLLVTKWSTSGCTANLKMGNCTLSPEFEDHEVSNGKISWTKGNDGTVSLNEPGSIYALCINEAEETTVNCTYSFEEGPDLGLLGGKPAQLVGEAAPFSVTASGSGICNSGTAELTTTYTVGSPEPLYLAPAAHGVFEGEEYPLILAGVNQGSHSFGFLGALVTCKSSALQNMNLGEPSEALIATPSYSECKLSGPAGYSVSFKNEGCEYTFDAGYFDSGSVEIGGCSGKGLVFTIDPEGAHPCTITFVPQTGKSVAYTTTGTGSQREIEIDMNAILEYHWVGTGIICPNSEGNEATGLDGTWDVSAENVDEEPVGIWLN